MADDEDSPFNPDLEEDPTEIEELYEEIDGSSVIEAPIYAIVAPALATAKPQKGRMGGCKTAKVISIKDIADAMGGE